MKTFNTQRQRSQKWNSDLSWASRASWRRTSCSSIDLLGGAFGRPRHLSHRFTQYLGREEVVPEPRLAAEQRLPF